MYTDREGDLDLSAHCAKMTIRCLQLRAAVLVLALTWMHAMLETCEARSTMEANSALGVNDALELSDVYLFVMQLDCNLVLYHLDVGPLWASQTAGQGTECTFVLQPDGNAVIYQTGNQFVWHTNTCCLNDGEHIITLQPDGNVVMHNGANQEIWATNTRGRL